LGLTYASSKSPRIARSGGQHIISCYSRVCAITLNAINRARGGRTRLFAFSRLFVAQLPQSWVFE